MMAYAAAFQFVILGARGVRVEPIFFHGRVSFII